MAGWPIGVSAVKNEKIQMGGCENIGHISKGEIVTYFAKMRLAIGML